MFFRPERHVRRLNPRMKLFSRDARILFSQSLLSLLFLSHFIVYRLRILKALVVLRWNFQKLRLLTYGVEVALKSARELFNRIQPRCSWQPLLSGGDDERRVTRRGRRWREDLIILPPLRVHAMHKADLHPLSRARAYLPGRAKLVPLYCVARWGDEVTPFASPRY